MRKKLSDIAQFQSGVYEKPAIEPDILYLQAVHFVGNSLFDKTVKPQLKLNGKLEKHLLEDGDLLFAAKGLNNFAVVYQQSIGKAVASSSFVVIRVMDDARPLINADYLAWFISHDKRIKLIHQQQLGTTIPSINMKQLGELEIDIPSLSVQEKIVAVQRLRDKEKELNAQLEAWRDREIQQLLSKATTK